MADKENLLAPLRGPDKSIQWYRTQIQKLGLSGKGVSSVIGSGIGKFAEIEIGGMYLFGYDPKGKKTLPYYDVFPLVLPFNTADGGFIGINLHYLPTLLRVELLKKLETVRTSKHLTATTRMRLSWDVLNKYSESQVSVKRYLLDHVQTRFLEINPQDWKTASLLPIERFVGATKEQVYKNSLKGML